MTLSREDILAGPPFARALLDAGMSPKEIHIGTQLFMSGEFLRLRKREQEDPELVKQIEEQEPHHVSGILLEICKKAGPDSATRHLAISRFAFLASGGSGPQKWCD